MPQTEAAGIVRFLLDFLVANHPAMFSVDELIREFSAPAEPADREHIHIYVEEGIAVLAGNGLVHRLGEFVFASRAAVCAHALSHQ